jgi:hypothetical protein
MRRKVPWHERWSVLSWLRRQGRTALFRLIERVFKTDDGRSVLAAASAGWAPRRVRLPPPVTAPYRELGRAPHRIELEPGRQPPIFITARFRSGSTFLWNVFRHIDGYTSYYEPHNERRWFDPRTREERVDATHKQVEEYWREYEGLEELGAWYREDWVRRDVYMDETFWAPEMRRYIELLIENARMRAVLQFNHVDFRLPWLRANFPQAKVIHLYRHPRDQWVSSLLGSKFPTDGSISRFRRCDHFYLTTWARDLKYHFPFLDERSVSHPYELFYYIWKLSYWFGRAYADTSVGFEDLVSDPRTWLTKLLVATDVHDYDLDVLMGVLERPEIGKWRRYADESWFERYEERCERVLAAFLVGAGPSPPASQP